jgi:hypothetical protein
MSARIYGLEIDWVLIISFPFLLMVAAFLYSCVFKKGKFSFRRTPSGNELARSSSQKNLRRSPSSQKELKRESSSEFLRMNASQKDDYSKSRSYVNTA